MNTKLKKCKAFHVEHSNGDHFLIAKDYMSGHKNRYTVFKWRVGKTVKIIGRELHLGWAKKVIGPDTYWDNYGLPF